jgi:ribose transport system substrate-binding protein
MDYTKEEAADAVETARELDVDVETIYADNDSILQGRQIMAAMDAKTKNPVAGIIVMPVGTNLPHLARAAAKAGIGWAVMHREADYDGMPDNVPVISLSSDNIEVGRIQGRQMAALLPKGGAVLYIEGPTMSVPSRMRRDGMMQTKPENITLRSIHSQWGRQHAQEAIASWMKLSTFRETKFDMVASVADGITMGAREELIKASPQGEREHWSSIPYLGCDGCRQTGMVWLSQRQLTATVRIPHLAGLALRMLHKGLNGERVERRTVLSPESYPDLNTLSRKARAATV